MGSEPEIDVPRARGHIELAIHYEGELTVAGWMLRPGLVFDGCELRLDGRSHGVFPVVERPELLAPFAFLAETRPAGFLVRLPFPSSSFERWTRIEVRGLHDGAAGARLDLLYRKGCFEGLPSPPEALLRKITGNGNADFHRHESLAIGTAVLDAVRRHGGGLRGRSLLHWGSGLGGVGALLRKHHPECRVAGAELDGEAVLWCRRHLPDIEFSVAPFLPPATYPDGRFDIVIADTILSRYDPPLQRTWLAEMQRLTRRGTLLLLGVLGEFAARLTDPAAGILEEMAMRGFSDRPAGPRSPGQPGGEPVRVVHQTEAFSREMLGEDFEILAYESGAIGAGRDLMVLRRR